MIGRGEAHGAVTIINAIAAGKGCAVGVDLRTWAEVELSPGEGVEVVMEGLPNEPTKLVSSCANAVMDHFSRRMKAKVRSGSQIPVSRGLKSSSAAANAVILATLDALGEKMGYLEVLRMNADISVAAGVSVTGSMDDAAASLLGGVVCTDNLRRKLLRREKWTLSPRVVIGVPERMIRKADLPRDRIAVYKPMVEKAFEMAWNRHYLDAMFLNGLCYGAALGLDQDLTIQAMKAGAIGAGISGTGPAVAAFVGATREKKVIEAMGPGALAVDVFQGEPI
ncbi:MAG: shikimate kinase [Methanomassiliicoccales archaeon]|nr:shikimate kinase [Methanomassiliicoccales archaeon]